MSKLAIITEYNPFHNGHLYQIYKAKEITNAGSVICLMSGNFLQRGECAYWDKYTRATMALKSGVDLILELPFCYATGSAHDFATGAVSILNKLNNIDYLAFGAECTNIDLFNQITNAIIEDSIELNSIIKEKLKEGNSFAKARSNALSIYLKNDEINEITSKPNNILAIEYLLALKKLDSDIKPVIIERKNAGYNDATLYNSISSASAIRATINENENISKIKEDVPSETFKIIKETYNISSPVETKHISPILLSKLINSQDIYDNGFLCGNFENICDMNKSLSDSLNNLSFPTDYEKIVDSLCSRQYPSTRIKRILLHLILGYTNEDRISFINNGYTYYANILGFKKDSSSIIKEISKKSSIPLITKKADFLELISNEDYKINPAVAKRMWTLDIMSTRLYNQLVYNQFGTTAKDDFSIKLPII